MTLTVFAWYLGILSCITLVAYISDKISAIRGKWRISEKCLLTLSFLGGAAGGYLGMLLARHKIRKPYFHLVNILGLAWQVALLIWLIGNPSVLF